MRPPLALPLLLLVGLALRLPWLARRPLWLDEALQHHVASAPDLAGVLARSMAEDLHPPAFSLLSHGILQVLPGEAGLRLLPLVAGTAAIAVAFGAGRAWLGPRAGLGLALLAATCPPWVAWSREGRPYAVALLALTGLLWAAGAVRRAPGQARWLVGCAFVAMFWHYGAWLVVGGVLLALMADPATRRPAGLAALAAAVAVAAHLPVLLAQAALRGDSPHLDPWTGAGALSGIPAAAGWLLTGSGGPAAAVLGLGVIGSGYALLRLTPSPAGADRGRLLAVTLLPATLLLVAALLGAYPLGPLRHTLVLAPGLLLLTASAASLRHGLTGLCGLAACMAMLSAVRAPGLPVEDVPRLLHRLDPHRAGAPVWVHPRLGYAARHYGLAEPVVWGRWGERPPEEGWRIAPSDAELSGDLRLDAPGVQAVYQAPERAP